MVQRLHGGDARRGDARQRIDDILPHGASVSRWRAEVQRGRPVVQCRGDDDGWQGEAAGVAAACMIAGILLALACGAAWPQAPGSAAPAALPEPSPEHLPRWRGFNLPDMVSADWARGPFREEDFRLIARLGFNFVRLPLDYRLWIAKGDWERIDAAAFAGHRPGGPMGIRYDLHVCLNLHRAPGYCVNPPAEPRNLFTDARAQRVCALHWAFIARRYRGIPNRSLSFNLLERAGHRRRRRLRPGRLAPVRGYPSRGSGAPHHRGRPVLGHRALPRSSCRCGWRRRRAATSPSRSRTTGPTGSKARIPGPCRRGLRCRSSSYLYGPMQGELAGPLAIEGPFGSEVRLRIRVGAGVSSSRACACGRTGGSCWTAPSARAARGEWKKAEYSTEWKIWQNLYDLDVVAGSPPVRARSRSRTRTATG